MDEESKQLLRQLVDAQREQTELLRKHVLPLWTRIRFSLLALFMLMTLLAVGIGFTVLAIRPMKPSSSTPLNATVVRIAPEAGTVQAAPNAGTFQFWTSPASVGRIEMGGDTRTLASPVVSP